MELRKEYFLKHGMPCNEGGMFYSEYVEWLEEKLKSHNKDYAEIALTINKMVHDECENVPHDIGWRIMKEVKDYFA